MSLGCCPANAAATPRLSGRLLPFPSHAEKTTDNCKCLGFFISRLIHSTKSPLSSLHLSSIKVTSAFISKATIRKLQFPAPSKVSLLDSRLHIRHRTPDKPHPKRSKHHEIPTRTIEKQKNARESRLSRPRSYGLRHGHKPHQERRPSHRLRRLGPHSRPLRLGRWLLGYDSQGDGQGYGVRGLHGCYGGPDHRCHVR